MSADFGEQLAFSGLEALSAPKKVPANVGAQTLAAENPVAEVCVEKLPIHLDQTFDYAVPEKFSAGAQPGVKVKVPFGGQTLDGYIVARSETSSHEGKLAALKSVVSAVPVLSQDSFEFFRSVADYYGGSLSDLTRLAVPPRHARAEKAYLAQVSSLEDNSEQHESSPNAIAVTSAPAADANGAPHGGVWSHYGAGPSFIQHLRNSCVDPSNHSGPRAIWTSLPGFGSLRAQDSSSQEVHWALAIVDLVDQVRATGRSSLIVVPTARDLARVRAALIAGGYSNTIGEDAVFTELSHELSAEKRYFNYLTAINGHAHVVIGTRASALVPLPNLGLAVCWDDAHIGHQELHAPYPHVREILSLRSQMSGCALVIGGYGRSIHAQALLANGWAHKLVASRSTIRAAAPRVVAFGEYEIEQDSGGKHGRLPGRVWQRISAALKHGPVLVQVPRTGYVPFTACARCRQSAHCSSCHGPLGLSSRDAVPQCTWCGALNGAWHCNSCGSNQLRAGRIGSDRTAEELGRAFPGVTVRVSGSTSKSGVLDQIPATPALVVATPGAQPYVPGGYALAALLDAHLSSGGSGLYANQEALDRWLTAAALVRSHARGGEVFLVGNGATHPTNALVRWDSATLAERELSERQELHLPPAWRIASITGEHDAVAGFLEHFRGPESAEVLGPVPIEDSAQQALLHHVQLVRAIVRVPVKDGRTLALSLKAMTRIASAKRIVSRITVLMDPKELV